MVIANVKTKMVSIKQKLETIFQNISFYFLKETSITFKRNTQDAQR